MKYQAIFVALIVFFAFSGSAWSLDVEVSKSGTVKTIQQAIDQIGVQGGTITITDSGVYEETVWIGDEMERSGQPITITSPFSGDARPVISPLDALGPFVEAQRADRKAGVAIFTDGCVLSNVILEGNPDANGQTGNGSCAMFVHADNVIIDNVLVRPRAGTVGETNYPNSAIFFAQEGAGESARPGGRNCDNCIVRNCDFIGVATDGQTEPSNEGTGYLISKENGQFATFLRTDHFTNNDSQMVDITVENCTFRYSYDAGIFFSNRAGGAGRVTLNVRDCFFDAHGKFQIGMRGCWLNVDRCIFSRACQGPHGDGENAAIRIQEQNGRIPDADISNSLFVNCGSGYSQRAYYGGVNNHNGGTVNVNHCTFDLCLSGVTLNSPRAESVLNVSNCIFNRIGYNAAPASYFDGLPPTDEDPFVLWYSPNFQTGTQISAVFNNFRDTGIGELNVTNCIVYDIAEEDSGEYLPGDPPLGTRLAAGEVTMTGVTRAEPIFVNMDYTAEHPYELAAGSPGIDQAVAALPAAGDLDLDRTPRVVGSVADMGAQEFGSITSIREWSVY